MELNWIFLAFAVCTTPTLGALYEVCDTSPCEVKARQGRSKVITVYTKWNIKRTQPVLNPTPPCDIDETLCGNIKDISTVELGGGPVKSEAASILFAPTGGQEGFVVALKKPNEKEHFYPKTKHTHPDVINVDAGNQLAPNLLWVEQKPPRYIEIQCRNGWDAVVNSCAQAGAGAMPNCPQGLICLVKAEEAGLITIKGKIKQVPMTIDIYGANENTEHFTVKIISDGSVPQPATTPAVQSTVSETTQASESTSTESTVSASTKSTVMPTSTATQPTEHRSTGLTTDPQEISPTTSLTEVTNESEEAIPTTSSAPHNFLTTGLICIPILVLLNWC